MSHGDTCICQNLVCLCQCQTQIHGESIILILRWKVMVIKSSWMYTTHRTIVRHSRAKQNMTMSKDKKAEAWTQSHVINPINLTLRSKVNVVSGSWMCATHHLMVIYPWAKYGKSLSNQTKVIGLKRICTDRWTDKVITIYPPPPHSRGYNNESQHSLQCQHCESTVLEQRKKVFSKTSYKPSKWWWWERGLGVSYVVTVYDLC